MSVRLDELGVSAATSVLGFDVARERKPGGGENSVWTIGKFNAAAYFGELVLTPAAVTLANGTLRNHSRHAVTAHVEITVSAPRSADFFATWEVKWTDVARETIAVQIPGAAAGVGAEALLIDSELMLRVPSGGRVKLALLDPEPAQFEEFIAMPVEAGE